ncbi:unnamed protein product [Mucor hiemalis]
MTREISVVKPHNNAPHKGCTSSSCCSPAKLWRSIQAFIKTNDEKGLIDFFKDSRQEHIVRVALTSRITNDAAMFPPSQKHKLIRIEDDRKLEANKFLGKSFNDLNSLQLALITSSESTVLTLLAQLKLYATRQELKLYLSHKWGQGNTSLHLAVFLKRYAVVKTLIDLGCQPDQQHLNARKKTAVDCCYDGDQRMIHLLSLHNQLETTTVKVKHDTVPVKTAITAAAAAPVVVPQTINIAINNSSLAPIEPLAKEEEQEEAKQQFNTDQPFQTMLKRLEDILLTQNNLSTILYEQEHLYLPLTQLKKPPDIRIYQRCLQQPYDVLLPPFTVTMSC